MNWNTIVIIVALLLAAFTVWQEYRRQNRARLVWRIMAVLVAVIALACIALPVSYHTKTKSGNKQGILLTQGFIKDSLSAYPNSKLFTADEAIIKANPKLSIVLVADLAAFAQKKYDVSGLAILGYGLDEAELNAMEGFPVQFHPSPAPSGVSDVSWDNHPKMGERLTIRGKFENLSGKKVSLVLKGLNTGLDSVIVPAKASQTFELGFVPKNLDKATCNLFAVAGQDTLENETIPFEVEPAKPLKVLMLASSPDFEDRFLKDWLAKNGYGLAIRTSISKAKFSYEYFNLPQTNTDNINITLLEKFDLLIGDLSVFKSLTLAENSALKTQISGKGLGIIVKADSSKGTSFLSNSFPVERLQIKDQKPTALSIIGKGTPSAKLLLDAFAIRAQNNTQPLIYDAQSHIQVSSTLYGSGKIIYSLLGNSYTWALSGAQDDYTTLWSALISNAARKNPPVQQWRVKQSFPKVNQPVKLVLEGPTALPGNVKAEGSLLAFKQNPVIPFQWDATYWPKSTGWQTVTQNNGAVFNWYVYDNGDWDGLLARQKITKTRQYAAVNKAANASTSDTEVTIEIPVSKLWFYLLLLLSSVYLWIERKL